MAADRRNMVLFSGGGWHYRGYKGFLMDEWILALSGKTKPRVCLLSTPQGDSGEQMTAFFRALNGRAGELSWAPMFIAPHPDKDPQEELARADIIYLPGGFAQGSVACLRATGWDVTVREAWESGTLIVGMCAGAMTFTRQWANRWLNKPGVGEGLGLLDISFTAHAQHKLYEPVGSIFRHGVRDGLLVPGYQLQDGFALHFRGTALQECITTEPTDAKGWFIEPAEDGQILEHELHAESLESRLRLGLDPSDEGFDTAMLSLSQAERWRLLRRPLNSKHKPFDSPELLTSSIESPASEDELSLPALEEMDVREQSPE